MILFDSEKPRKIQFGGQAVKSVHMWMAKDTNNGGTLAETLVEKWVSDWEMVVREQSWHRATRQGHSRSKGWHANQSRPMRS